MQVGNISLASQRFALTRCNCSSSSQAKKTRKRKSKEERRAMVETFISKFRETNKGTFPSLNLTHREVGGSFYIVREIVRDIIQENRVLGPGDLDLQTLTLENVPISPEICENGTGLEKDFGGNGGVQYIDVGSLIEIETETIEKSESEIKEEKSEISMDNGKISTGDLHKESEMEVKAEENEKVYEIKELLTEIAQNNGKISTGDLHENSVMEIEKETNEKSDSEIKEVKSEIIQNNGKISTEDLHEMPVMEVKTETVEKSVSGIKEVKSDIIQNNGKISTGDLHEKSVMEVKTGAIKKSESEIKEKSEISQDNGKITTGDLHESEMKVKVEPTENSESEMKEKKSEQLSTGDLHLESKMEVETETIEKSEFEIKEVTSEISQNNGKISTAETAKFEKLGSGLGDSKLNDGFERAKRTVVQVEQFPLPSKSYNKKDSDSVLADGKNKEQELVEAQETAGGVNSKTETQNKIENSVSSNSSAQEKNVATMPKTENEAVSRNTTKTKKVPIDEHLMRRHGSHLKLDYMSSEMISLDASINRETAKKKREKAQANPFWVTFQAFITSVVKFWTE